MSEIAQRANKGKVQWSLAYWPAVEEMVRVLEYGASKYSADNWKQGQNREELLESMQRHVLALMKGEEEDSDPKAIPTHHIGHIMCNCMFYFYHLTNDTFTSERRSPYGEAFKQAKQ